MSTEDRPGSSDRGLAIEPAGAPERRVALPSKGVLIVGSEPGGAGLVVRSEGVARTHVAIAPLKGGGHGVKLIAEDAGAQLNGQPIRTAKLSLGDELQLGETRLLIVHTETGTQSDGLASGKAGRDAGGALRADAIPGFRLIENLGRGAVGRVVLAHQENLDRRVAIKLLDKGHAKDAEFVQRFRDEARAAAALHHANVVTVFDVGEAEGQPYLVMEYMARGSLEDRLTAEGPLPWRAVLGVLRDAASGLEFAGSKGIVHRDMKPANLMQTNTGETKIADLGLATSNFAGASATSGKIQGTPHFMAPEQARGEAVDERADLYALGASAWRLLTGETPFAGKDAREILRAAQSEDPRPPSELAIGCPAGVDALVLELMAKDRDERPRSAALLKARVDQLIANNGHSPNAATGGRRGPLLVGALVLVIAGGVGAAAWLQRGGASDESGGSSLGDPLDEVAETEPGDAATLQDPGDEVELGAAPLDPDAGALSEGALGEEDGDASYERKGREKFEAAKSMLDPEAQIAMVEEVIAAHDGSKLGAEAVAYLNGLLATPTKPDPALTTTETVVSESTEDRLSPWVEELRLLAFSDDLLLPAYVGLAAVAAAEPPAEAIALRSVDGADGLEAFEARRSALIEELSAVLQVEANQRLDVARERATEGAFDSAEDELTRLLGWLRDRGEDEAPGSDATESERSATRVAPLGATSERGTRATTPPAAEDPEDLAAADASQGPAFDVAFLIELDRRAVAFQDALPSLQATRGAFLRQTDRARLSGALWPDALAGALSRGEHEAAAALLAALLPSLEHAAYRLAVGGLRDALVAAVGFDELVRRTWDAKEWKRQRLQLPGAGSGFAEAVSVDARGVSVEDDGGAPRLVQWSEFALDPDATLNLVQARLDRDWTRDEQLGIAGFLLSGTLANARSDALEGLERGGLPGSAAGRLLEHLDPLATFAEGLGDPDFAALIDRERSALERVSTALSAAQDRDWANATFELERLFDESSDSTLVWMLSDGTPPREPILWPPPTWPDARDADEASPPTPK